MNRRTLSAVSSFTFWPFGKCRRMKLGSPSARCPSLEGLMRRYFVYALTQRRNSASNGLWNSRSSSRSTM